MSPSSRGRGLKSKTLLLQKIRKQSRPLHEGVDWNVMLLQRFVCAVGRPLHEGVDWNIKQGTQYIGYNCRPLHEGVDWNSLLLILTTIMLRRPLHEGVDWNTSRDGNEINGVKSPSSRGRGLKLIPHWIQPKLMMSPSSRGRGLKSAKSTATFRVNMVALFTRAWIEI